MRWVRTNYDSSDRQVIKYQTCQLLGYWPTLTACWKPLKQNFYESYQRSSVLRGQVGQLVWASNQRLSPLCEFHSHKGHDPGCWTGLKTPTLASDVDRPKKWRPPLYLWAIYLQYNIVDYRVPTWVWGVYPLRVPLAFEVQLVVNSVVTGLLWLSW